MNVLRHVESVNAPNKNLLKAFVKLAENPLEVEKLQIKQLLLAIELIFAHEEDSLWSQTKMMENCRGQLLRFLEAPNVSLNLRA